RDLHPPARPQLLPGRAHHLVELSSGDDRGDAGAGDARLRLPAALYRAGHRLDRGEVAMASLELRKVVKRYQETEVIHGVDLKAHHGEFVVFVGPSGCGKSTLLRMICGLEEVSAGDVLIDGVRVNDLPAARRGLAMVFQSYALYPHMTVYQNLSFGLENIGTPRAQIAAKVAEAPRMLRP